MRWLIAFVAAALLSGLSAYTCGVTAATRQRAYVVLQNGSVSNYKPPAVELNGYAEALRISPLQSSTGGTIASTPYGRCSFWLKGNIFGANGDYPIAQSNGSAISESGPTPGGFVLAFDNSSGALAGRLRETVADGVSKYFNQISTNPATFYTPWSQDTWVHVDTAWDSNAAAHSKRMTAYFNNVQGSVNTVDSDAAFNVDYAQPNVGIFGTVIYQSGQHYSSLDAADVWCDFSHNYMTAGGAISAADRAKFANLATNRPLYLGENGQLPYGYIPTIFLHGDSNHFLHNRGYGGEMVDTMSAIVIGGTVAAGDNIGVVLSWTTVNGSAGSATLSYTTLSGDTKTSVATAIANACNGSVALLGVGISCTTSAAGISGGTIVSFYQPGLIPTPLAVSFSSTGLETGSYQPPQGGQFFNAPFGPAGPSVGTVLRNWWTPWPLLLGGVNEAAATSVPCYVWNNQIASGDLLICTVLVSTSSGDPGTITPPSGWVIDQQNYDPGTASSAPMRFAIAHKLASSTDAQCATAVISGATISGTTLTFSTLVSGQVCAGQQIQWSSSGGVSGACGVAVSGTPTIVSGSGTSWTISTSETVSTACNMQLSQQYTFSWVNSSKGQASLLMDYTGVNQSTPVDASQYQANTSNSTSIAIPSLALANPNETTVDFAFSYGNGGPYACPLLLNERFDGRSISSNHPEILACDGQFTHTSPAANATQGKAATSQSATIAIVP
jgi:hypothetical protein